VRRVVGLVALLLAAAPVGVAAASPSPTLDLSLLGTTLAGAPDPGWVEQVPRNNILQGQFDAARYVDVGWTEQSVRDTIRNRLLGDGFIGGYGRSFYKKSLDGWIVEGYGDRNRARAYALLGARAAFPLERRFGGALHRIEPALELRALSNPKIDILQDAFSLPCRNEGTDKRIQVGRIADRHRVYHFAEFLHE